MINFHMLFKSCTFKMLIGVHIFHNNYFARSHEKLSHVSIMRDFMKQLLIQIGKPVNHILFQCW
jgi:hypothetical protein